MILPLIIGILLSAVTTLPADTPYQHDKFIDPKTKDLFFRFDAFVVSFDGKDDDDGDGKPDQWGIPHWVAYEIRRKTKLHKLETRPKWTTDKELFKLGIAPDDSTYSVSGTHKLKAVKTSSRFVRGHLCPKSTAERISQKAARETFTLLNAVPMLQSTNNGIWKRLEQHCHDLADKHGRIWVITGPVFFNNRPSMWLGQPPEKLIAIPDAFFKTIFLPNCKSTTYLIPNITTKPKTLEEYISVAKKFSKFQ